MRDGRLGKWLLLLDLDGTLWDHEDISTLNPPFKRQDKHTVIDRQGNVVRIYRDMVKLTKWAKENGAITSTLSWNIPDNAIAALKAFQITEIFDYITIDYTPRKDIMLKKLLKKIEKEEGLNIQPCKIIYIDDRDIHIEDIYNNIGQVNFIQIWKDFNDFETAKKLIVELLSSCR